MKKYALITGAASGIGRDTAQRFLDNGYIVLGCDISAGCIEDAGGNYIHCVLDLSKTSSFTTALEVVSAWRKLDVLVQCAGVCSATSLDEMTEQEWDFSYSVNVRGPFFLTQRLLPFLIKGENPCIVQVSSMAGFTGGIRSNPAYSSSKAALSCMTKNLAKVCAPMGIRVNEVSPGTADTAMTRDWLGESAMREFAEQVPMGRLATAEDIGKVILFLASDAAGFITGQSIQVNGGMYIP